MIEPKTIRVIPSDANKYTQDLDGNEINVEYLTTEQIIERYGDRIKSEEIEYLRNWANRPQ